MKAVCISDTHGYHDSIDFTDYQDHDTLIFAGDWTRTTHDQQIETRDFLDWLENLNFKHKIIIAGNHELSIERKNSNFRQLLSNYKSITYLQDSSVIIDGIKLHGSPYSNQFFNWAFMGNESKLTEIWNLIPDDTNILITHGPAHKTLDKVNRTFGNEDQHVGSKSLRARKLELPNLTHHISGHIHESYGELLEDNILNICPSICTLQYRPTNKPITFEI